MNEQQTELQGTKLAKAMGWVVLKQQDSPGIPDKLYFKEGRCFFVEWKRPDGKGRIAEDQEVWRKVIEKNGTVHAYCKNLEEFRKVLIKVERRYFSEP